MKRSQVTANFKSSPGVQDGIEEIVCAIGCTVGQALTLYKAGYETIDDVINAPEKELRLLPRIGKLFFEKLSKAKRVYFMEP